VEVVKSPRRCAYPNLGGTLDAGERQYQLACSSDVAKRHAARIRQIAPFDPRLAGPEAKAL
jgi:hypothetical protein